MKFNKLFFLLFNCLIFTLTLNSQRINNEIIVEIESEHYLSNFLSDRSFNDLQILPLDVGKGFYLLKFEHEVSETEFQKIKNYDGIIEAAYNEQVQLRQKPNDAFYEGQWALRLTNIEKIWEVTQGGKQSNGNDIVVAVMDDGIDINHEDLAENIFFNKAEIENDGLDNDGNGYKDDYRGFNVNFKDGSPLVRAHGTGVAGIIGAKGNNSIGISGVNWNIKLLPIVGVNNTSDILLALSYVLEMKKLYLTTNGKKGANILVLNYSGGVANKFPTDFPYNRWCQYYDELGLVGILSIGATDNENVDVSIKGDMPSTCLSEYLISTTNIDRNTNKVMDAAYGKNYVTMAAPGEGLYTTDINNTYDKMFAGTSASAPMIAGVAALLFSLPCPFLSDLTKSDPPNSVRAVRDAIKNGVRKTDKLMNQTRWGGYLDANQAMQKLTSICVNVIPAPKGPLKINFVNVTNNVITVNYVTPDEEDGYELKIFDIMGRTLFTQSMNIPKFNTKEFSTSLNLNNGIYIVSIFKDDKVASKTFANVNK